MARCLIGLGSNLGDRRAALSTAISRFEQDARLFLVAKSRWRETKPAGGPDGQPKFLNGAAIVETSLPPRDVLDLLEQIENEQGRKREATWGPRQIDLDLLLYNEEKVQTPRLTVPHPRMAWRRFVLEPAAEIAGQMVHVETGWTIARLLGHLNSAHNYVAIAGPIGVGKTHLARQIVEKTSARMVAEELDAGRLERFYHNPSGTAWETELEFLRQRARLLAADRPEWSDRGQLVVSDFWFDQSAAFAKVWLDEKDFRQFRSRWEEVRASVVKPKLTVVLSEPAAAHKPGDWLFERVKRRGRAYEANLSAEVLGKIARAVSRQADEPDLGPQLKMSAENPQAVLNEVLAAIEAMG
ncbi:MAG: 2-amino-4-hydroxy-6-hydroxymethyldihydropteridine diphosphokinase [Planctomycetota bacterium]|nr:2-amino-4-hydroxy-6-hydroxymethyldihydropteridine diphosphokinase [Planctomycetota bacterium]